MSYIVYGFYYLLYGFSLLIFVDIILSWFPMVYRFKIFRILHAITDSYMGFFRGYITAGMFDFTPLVGIILFDVLTSAYVWLLNF